MKPAQLMDAYNLFFARVYNYKFGLPLLVNNASVREIYKPVQLFD